MAGYVGDSYSCRPSPCSLIKTTGCAFFVRVIPFARDRYCVFGSFSSFDAELTVYRSDGREAPRRENRAQPETDPAARPRSEAGRIARTAGQVTAPFKVSRTIPLPGACGTAIIRIMAQFLKHNTTAVIALVGVAVGSLLTGGFALWNAWVMRDRDLNLKLWERFLDRRITAHETVVSLALKMRFMCSFGKVDSSGEVVRVPQVMMSKEAFNDWLVEFAEKSVPATTWLSTRVKRELNFVQDYFVTLHTNLSAVPSAHFGAVGSFVRQDFIDLSSKLEKTAFEFFKAEARELRLNDLTEHHKYRREETEHRLQNTVLLRRWKEIQALTQSGQAPI